MKFIVAFYEIDRAIGGPEEGGWHYDTGQLERLVRICRNKGAAYAAAKRANRLIDRLQRSKREVSSVLYTGGRHRAYVFAHNAPPHFPDTPPTYS